MVESPRFKVVFAKLREALDAEKLQEHPDRVPEASFTELEELEELSRVVSEISDPDPQSYTTT